MWRSFVKSPVQCWLLFSRAKRFHQLPSAVLGLRNSYVAYCLDECIDVFGTWVEGQLDSIPRMKKESEESYNAKRQRRLMELVAPVVRKEETKAYAAPVARSWKGGKNGRG